MYGQGQASLLLSAAGMKLASKVRAVTHRHDRRDDSIDSAGAVGTPESPQAEKMKHRQQ